MMHKHAFQMLLFTSFVLALGACSEKEPSEGEAANEAGAEAAEEAKSEEGKETSEATEGEAKADEAASEEAKPAAEAAPPEKKDDVKPIDGKENPTLKAETAKKLEGGDAQQNRQAQLQAVYALGRKGDDDSLKGLVDIIKSDKEAGIRATAVRVLGRTPRAELVEMLTAEAKSDVLPVKIEASILLYQWGEKKIAQPILEQLSSQGVALRRAFLTGRKDGKNQYDKAAKKFLSKGLKSDNVYTRLDAALGLYEMGQGKDALGVFKTVMETEETFYVRMAALNYLRHLKSDDAVRGVIEIATKDKDERVSQRANQILNEPVRGAAAPAKK